MAYTNGTLSPQEMAPSEPTNEQHKPTVDITPTAASNQWHDLLYELAVQARAYVRHGQHPQDST